MEGAAGLSPELAAASSLLPWPGLVPRCQGRGWGGGPVSWGGGSSGGCHLPPRPGAGGTSGWGVSTELLFQARPRDKCAHMLPRHWRAPGERGSAMLPGGWEGDHKQKGPGVNAEDTTPPIPALSSPWFLVFMYAGWGGCGCESPLGRRGPSWLQDPGSAQAPAATLGPNHAPSPRQKQPSLGQTGQLPCAP